MKKLKYLGRAFLAAFLIFGFSAATEDTPCGGHLGALHVYGGGFVASTASAAKTAFVGPKVKIVM